eukprot:scaffold31260_cov17-Tisochrysis_lutea.AAC.6
MGISVQPLFHTQNFARGYMPHDYCTELGGLMISDILDSLQKTRSKKPSSWSSTERQAASLRLWSHWAGPEG